MDHELLDAERRWREERSTRAFVDLARALVRAGRVARVTELLVQAWPLDEDVLGVGELGSVGRFDALRLPLELGGQTLLASDELLLVVAPDDLLVIETGEDDSDPGDPSAYHELLVERRRERLERFRLEHGWGDEPSRETMDVLRRILAAAGCKLAFRRTP